MNTELEIEMLTDQVDRLTVSNQALQAALDEARTQVLHLQMERTELSAEIQRLTLLSRYTD
jgi:predicted  nucleic acid-binding Zn-ribbon protein